MAEKISEIQDEIIEEFSLLEGDQEMTNFYIMELGQKLPELEEKYKIEDNIIKGCQSKVWVVPEAEDDRLHFKADSNSAITKGLVSLLVRIFDHQKVKDILDADLYFIDKIGMNRFIGTQRSNGFAAMIKQIKLFALVQKDRIEATK
ncbi:cysteine desulfuration protein SufE [Catalinimonas alkaloidigena]|uniref:SufE family protein n=1 Tax=Catalinimonas alkaloidigena TaxID=1075417 RepID=UPI0024061B91|nr:SufE family protein [Catalinimonas alkaloidigena]MDF9795764.1 cysteine desulfuration protein SufE [Catalinimonas alkaloidigena]